MKKIFNKGFFKRFIICLLVYSLLMSGIIIALRDLLYKAHLSIKIIVGVVIVCLFFALIIYVEVAHRKKE